MLDMTNLVMCVPAGKVNIINPLNVDDHACWLPREQAETNERYRQVIPYCAIRRGDGKYLTYRRKGTEERLHGLISMGVGGHIDNGETIAEGTSRELMEEANITVHDSRFMGLIVMDKNTVDRVHLGLMFEVCPASYYLQDELREPKWMTLDEITEIKGDLEPWSQYMLNELVNPF